jgi:hypothetical protein
LLLEKNQEIKVEGVIKKLISLWFIYSEFNKNGSFKKNWEILTINEFKGNKQYKVSFWWDIIEEIFLYDILFILCVFWLNWKKM